METKSQTATETPPILRFLERILFRAANTTTEDIYQITTTPITSSSSNTSNAITQFQIFSFLPNQTEEETNTEPLCNGEIIINTMSMGNQQCRTVVVSGDLTAVGLEANERGTLDPKEECITWCNGSQWVVHARVVEDELESYVGMNVTNMDMLTPAQLKLQMLFSKFDTDLDGVLNFSEFVKLDQATEDDPQEMTEASFHQIINIVQSVRENDNDRNTENVGLDLIDLTCVYVGPVAEMFQTNLNADFAAVFPQEAKVAFIFEAFDRDQDGFWSPEEEAEYVTSTGRGNEALKWFRNEDGTTAVGITAVMPLYLDDDSPFFEELENDFQLAGEKVFGNGSEE